MRIKQLTKLVDECEVFMDVGCDHGLLTLGVIKAHKCELAFATDISDECLKKAKKTLRAYENVQYVACDGIAPSFPAPDFIAICGMGGHTIEHILSNYVGSAKLLLSPQSHPERVRMTLEKLGYKIVFDNCYIFKNKFYDIIKAEKGTSNKLTELELIYGNYKQKSEAFELKLRRMMEKLPKDSEKLQELTELMKWQK